MCFKYEMLEKTFKENYYMLTRLIFLNARHKEQFIVVDICIKRLDILHLQCDSKPRT